MDHYKLVLPEHLNHYGFLFGGYMLKWIDEFAYITATIDYPDHEFVTVAMDKLEFKHSVKNGEVLRFSVEPLAEGTTSVTYQIDVYGEVRSDIADQVLFTTTVSFVSVDKNGDKTPLKRKHADTGNR